MVVYVPPPTTDDAAAGGASNIEPNDAGERAIVAMAQSIRHYEDAGPSNAPVASTSSSPEIVQNNWVEKDAYGRPIVPPEFQEVYDQTHQFRSQAMARPKLASEIKNPIRPLAKYDLHVCRHSKPHWPSPFQREFVCSVTPISSLSDYCHTGPLHAQDVPVYTIHTTARKCSKRGWSIVGGIRFRWMAVR